MFLKNNIDNVDNKNQIVGTIAFINGFYNHAKWKNNTIIK